MASVSRFVGAIRAGITEGVGRVRTAAPSDLAASGLLLLVLVSNLWVLRAEAIEVSTPNDANIHAAMVDWAEARIRGGHLPFDGWFPVSSLGASRFHQYQSLPHLLIGAVQAVTGADGLVSLSLYLLLALWPISVYAGGRLFGLDHRTSVVAAALAPLLGGASSRGMQLESYIFNGSGLWAQAWGMWLLPLAWGASWRAISGRGSSLGASVLLGLTVLAHLLVGYLAMASVALWVVLRPSEWRARIPRALTVWLGAFAVSGWFLIPFLTGRAFIPHAEIYDGREQFDSFGLTGVSLLLKGLIFDVAGRLPFLSALVGWGIWSGFRHGGMRDEGRRAIFVGLLASFLLFLGKPVLGPLVALLPGGGDLFLNRFIFGVQAAGIYVAATGVVALFRPKEERVAAGVPLGISSIGNVVFAGLLVAAAFICFRERWAVAGESAASIREQARVEATALPEIEDLLAFTDGRPPGRVFTGLQSRTLRVYRRNPFATANPPLVGKVSLPYVLSRAGVELVGFPRPAWSLMSSHEGLFDDTSLGDFRLFAVRYALLRVGESPSVSATRLAVRGDMALWEIDESSSYIRVVQTDGPPIATDRWSIGRDTESVLSSSRTEQGIYVPVAFGGRAAAEPTGVTEGFVGTVEAVEARLADGLAAATVTASAPADVVLSASYDPRWTVTVDGVAAPVEMLAPALPAVRIQQGRHAIVFRYAPVGGYGVRMFLGVAVLAGLAVVDRRRRRVAVDGPAEVSAGVPWQAAGVPVGAQRGGRSANAKRRGKRR